MEVYFIINYIHLIILMEFPSLSMQPMSMVLPGVVGFKLTGKLRDGMTATDLVLTVTQMLRKHGVVGKFVEFHGTFMKDLISYFIYVTSLLTQYLPELS